MRRNQRGRFCNPQPVLFLGLRDNPGQGLLFDGTDDLNSIYDQAALFGEMESQDPQFRQYIEEEQTA